MTFKFTKRFSFSQANTKSKLLIFLLDWYLLKLKKIYSSSFILNFSYSESFNQLNSQQQEQQQEQEQDQEQDMKYIIENIESLSLK